MNRYLCSCKDACRYVQQNLPKVLPRTVLTLPCFLEVLKTLDEINVNWGCLTLLKSQQLFIELGERVGWCDILLLKTKYSCIGSVPFSYLYEI